MAVTYHKGSRTIRGITYAYGDSFKCYASNGGATDSEGSGSAASLTVGTTYYFLGYSIDDDTDTLTSYPYAVGGSASTIRGWYKENVFPYATYTIKYNANGGSGAPSSQTKTYGTNLTLSSTKPTRTGYTFKGWALTQTDANNGTWYYQPGGTCGKNENLTLYAVWEEHILTVNYYSNYATSAFADALNAVGSDKNVKVWTTEIYYDNDYSTYGLANYSNSSGSVYMTRTGYTATGKWGTSTSGGTLIDENTGYSTGQALAKALGKDLSSGNASINVYAQWQENALTINYYSNYANYGSFNGEVLSNVKADANVLVYSHKYYYDNAYSDGVYNIQNSEKLYLTRTGYTSTLHWGTSTSGGTLIDQYTAYDTGQALAKALGKDISSGDASINLYPQWQINTYTLTYNASGGSGSMSSQTVEWQEVFSFLANKFSREGYKFVGWNLRRDNDNKWYALGQGWHTEDEIDANGYSKKVYPDQEELTFDASWIRDNEEARAFTLYATWKLSGVVYIDNGTTLEPYLPYIDNGSEWEVYLAYVDNGTEWEVIS